MLFGIFIIAVLGAIGYFHYVQGFFSSTISAIVAAVSAVVAVSYYESLVEGPLASMSPNWMPALILLGLFALSYVILRTIFDKMVPGGVQMPAVIDKIGGAAMGAVAGIFGLGVVVIAAQHLPFSPSIGGYVRYETESEKDAPLPTAKVNSRPNEAKAYDVTTKNSFDDESRKSLLGIPVDDMLVATVAHLSDNGSLSNGKPFRDVHPDLLQELFGSRLGVERASNHVAFNNDKQKAFEVVGMYLVPDPFPENQIVDHEFKRTRAGSVVKVSSKTPTGELRVAVRVRFTAAAAEAKDKRVRLSPASVRLVAKRPGGVRDDLEPANYFPIGTIEANGVLYANKIDDPLFIDVTAKRADGTGDAAAEVDFVFQVKEKGFATSSGNQYQAAPGTFIEIKKSARADLSNQEIKATMKPLPVLAVRRKHLEWNDGPKPPAPGAELNALIGASAAAPPGDGPGGGELGKRLVGTWENRGLPGQPTTVYTFAADGTMSGDIDGQKTDMKWMAAGPPQGEALTIKTGADPASGQQMAIVFTDADQFDLSDAAGATKHFKRTGSATDATPAPAPTPAPDPTPEPITAAPDPTMSRMLGTWESPDKFVYTFRIDWTYSAAKGGQTGSGTWRITGSEQDGTVVNVELTNKKGVASPQKWNLTGASANPAQIERIDTDPKTVFKRTS